MKRGLRSSFPFEKLYKKVYIRTVGSATPCIRSGCPPNIVCINPHIAAEQNVCTEFTFPPIQSTHNTSYINNKRYKLITLICKSP